MEFKGTYKVMFVGKEDYSQIVLDHHVQDAYGHPIYLVGVNEEIYNWSNIVIMIKVN